MKTRFKIGSQTPTGQTIAAIWGQNQSVCVYTTTDNHLRWNYIGPVPAHLRPVIDQFDVLMSRIKKLPGSIESKQHLYELLGKRLFSTLSAPKDKRAPDPFKVVEQEIAEARLANKKRKPAIDHHFDIAIICAIHDPELAKVLTFGKWSTLASEPNEPQTYHVAEWTTKTNRKLRVVAAAPNQMGLVSSGVLAAKVVWRFRPRVVAMVGIAAGANDEGQGFGDILAPDVTFDLGSAKLIERRGELEIRQSPNPLHCVPRLVGKLNKWKHDQGRLDAIAGGWQSKRPRTSLRLHVGPLFSGPVVVGTKRPISEIASHWRKLVGVEMEAHAVHRACTDTVDPPPVFLCLKSICDFAKNKNDDWQHYAAYTAARFCYEFLMEEWPSVAAST